MAEIYSFLEEHEGEEKKVLLKRIKNYFDLTEQQAIKIYSAWKKEYMKPRIKVDLSTKGGWRMSK